MKSVCLVLSLVLVGAGCSDRQTPTSQKAESNVRSLIALLATNVTVKAVKESEGIRLNLVQICDEKAQERALAEWRRALMNMPLGALNAQERYEVIRAAVRALAWNYAGALHDVGGEEKEIWFSKLDTLKWLDGKIRETKVACLDRGRPFRAQKESWQFYLALVGFREQFVENLERFDFPDACRSAPDQERDRLRKPFEHLIGRRARNCEEILRLGVYVRERRDRVQKEIDGYLRGECSSTGEIDCSDGIVNLQEE